MPMTAHCTCARAQEVPQTLPLTNTLPGPGPSASEVTSLWRYTNMFIIIIIT